MDSRLKFVYVGTLLLITTLGTGVCGYVFIEGATIVDALYMTVITVSTVGFGEVIPLSKGGKLFTIVIIIMGTGTVAYTAAQLVEYFVAGELRDLFGRKKMDSKINAMKDHYILCGFGRMGTVIAKKLWNEKIPFVIVDPMERHSETADNKYLFVTGDATNEAVLKKAGVDRAKGLITVVDSDIKNLYIVLTAKSMKSDLYVVSKASQEEALSKIKWAGADKIVSPYTISGHKIANSITKPNVSYFFETLMGGNDLNINVEEVTIGENSVYAGKMIKETNVRTLGIIIVAIKKKNGAFIYNPGPNEVIMVGDTLISLGRKEDFESLEKFL